MVTKQILKVLFVLTLSLHNAQAAKNISVFTCEPEWASLAKTLGGDKLDIFSATTSKDDPHHIQPRPKLISKARKAELLICTGSDLEVNWLPILISKSGNKKIIAGEVGSFMVGDYVRLEDPPHTIEKDEAHIHAYGNPHVHLDPGRILIIANLLTKRLSSLDPVNAAFYDGNLVQFSQDWSQASSQWYVATEAIQGKTVVLHHSSWVYLQRWLNLKTVAILETQPGIAASSKHLASVVTEMKATPADMIIHSQYQNSRASQWLSDKTGIPIISLPFSPDADESLIEWYGRIIKTVTGLFPEPIPDLEDLLDEIDEKKNDELKAKDA